MTQNGLFIGTPTLEGFADLCQPDRPVYATKLVEPGRSGSAPLRSHGLVILVQQITAEGSVLYCRIPAARIDTLYGEPSNTDWREREAAWDSLWQLAKEYLRDIRHLDLFPASIAIPQNLILIDGEYGGVRFDSTSQRYVPRLSINSGTCGNGNNGKEATTHATVR